MKRLGLWSAIGVALGITLAPGAVLGQEGGGETEAANNLSFPAVLTSGAVTLPGSPGLWTLGGTYPASMSYGCATPETIGQFEFPNTSCVDDAGAPLSYPACAAICGAVPVERIYWQKQPANVWQAQNLADQGAQIASFVAWGDNLRSRTWTVDSQIRVETTPYVTLGIQQLGFQMWHVFGHGSNELWGVRATDTPPGDPYGYSTGYAIIRTPSARLNFTKLNGAIETCGGTTPYADSFTWDPSAESKWGALQMMDVAYTPELNIGGKFVYGYNWAPKNLTMPTGTHKAGWWRLTFYAPDVLFDATTAIEAPTLPDAAPMATPDPIVFPEEAALYTPVVDAINHITYIDICLNTGAGGGGGGGGGGAGAPTIAVTITGTGTGAVTSNPAGIDCGSTCSAQFEPETVVTLTATPAAGSHFSGWTGCPAPSGNQCVITMVAHTDVGVMAGFGLVAAHRARSDFNADGRSDLLWQHADGRTAVWLMNGFSSAFAGEIREGGSGWSVVHVADFDGDGMADLLWRHVDGRVSIWLMNGMAPSEADELLAAGSGWSVVQTPDLNGDGKADLLWRHTDGSVAAWLMDGTAMSGGDWFLGAGTGWSVNRVADFDGDGRSDLLWAHTDGRAAIWLMNGLVPAVSAEILPAGTGWSAMQVPDLDGDGRADILWRHANGSIAAWLMNGASMASGSGILGPATGWMPTQVADFDGDGKGDIVFRHTDGRVAIWLMNGLTPASTAEVLGPSTPWSVRRIADLDGDGKSDIVWRHVDGSVAAWLMNGVAIASGAGMLGPSSGWIVSTASP